MNFLYPQFLYALTALAIPVIIHLFNFRKAKKVYFSSNRFLKNIKKTSSSRLKLKRLLVLAARLLFIAFLVLAFAQPYFPAREAATGNEDIYIYLDNSLSMSNETPSGLSAFDASVQYVNRLIDQYPAGAQYKLLTNDFAPFSNNLKSMDEIREALTEARLSGVSRSFEEVYQRLFTGDHSDARPDRLFWISDFQKSTTGELPQLTDDTLRSIYLVPMTFQTNSNVYIDSIYLTNPFVLPDEKNELQVVLKNSGSQQVEDLIIKFFINDIQASSASVGIDQNSSASVTLPLSFGLEKTNRCRIAFEDFPVAFDNDFYFTINQIDRIVTMEIKGSPGASPIEKVFGNADLFNFSSVSASNLEYSRIEASDLVVVNQLTSIDASLAGVLRAFLEGGGSIVLIPASNADVVSYQQLIPSLTLEKTNAASKRPLAMPDLANPFYRNIFEERSERFNMPEAVGRLTWNNRSGDLLTFANGDPYLSAFSNPGNLYIFGSPLSDEYTMLHRHAIFLPLMYRIAALSKQVNENLYYSLNETSVALNMDSLRNNVIYKLRADAGDQEIIPSQMISGKKLILELPKYILNSGFYSLTLDDGAVKELAFNQDKKESILTQYSPEELQEAFSLNENVHIFEAEQADDFERNLKSNFQGTPLWRYLLVMAMLFLLTEILLIRFL